MNDAMTITPTFKGFLEFCKTKNLSKIYDYTSNDNCPFAQYLKSLGAINPIVIPHLFSLDGGKTFPHKLPRFKIDERDSALDELIHYPSNGMPRTFGALVKRLEAVEAVS